VTHPGQAALSRLAIIIALILSPQIDHEKLNFRFDPSVQGIAKSRNSFKLENQA